MNDLQKTFVAITQAMKWTSEANCKNMDTNLFFTEYGAHYDPFAKEVCGSCPVSEECLWYANETKATDGYFGGMTPSQRDTWRRRNKIPIGTSKHEWETRSMNYLHTSPSEWRER